MNFRRAEENDAASIMKVRLSVKENQLTDTNVVNESTCIEFMEHKGVGWVCESDGEIIGFSFANVKQSRIWALFVLPEFEGRRVGQKLLKLAVEFLRSKGAKKLELSTERGTRAEQFYLKMGWSPGKIDDKNEIHFSYLLS